MVVSKRYIIFFCLILSIFMGLSLDIYIPSLTHIQAYFHATSANIQLTLSVFLCGYAFVQLIYGVTSDALGRRKPLIVGLSIYLIGNIGCFLSISAKMLIAFRLVESFGAASAIVTGYAIARDIFSGIQCTKVLSYMSIATSVAPIILSILGGYIVSHYGWHYVFSLISVVTLSILILVIFKLPETNKHIEKLKFSNYLSSYKAIINNRTFFLYTICGSSIFVTLFCFISAMPFIAFNIFHISSQKFGYLLAANSACLIVGYLFVNATVKKLSVNKIIFIGSSLMMLSGAFGFVYLYILKFTLTSFPAFTVMFIISIGLGMIFPSSQSGLLQPFPDSSAKANALANLIRFLPASVIGNLVANSGNHFITLIYITLASGTLNFLLIFLLSFDNKK